MALQPFLAMPVGQGMQIAIQNQAPDVQENHGGGELQSESMPPSASPSSSTYVLWHLQHLNNGNNTMS